MRDFLLIRQRTPFTSDMLWCRSCGSWVFPEDPEAEEPFCGCGEPLCEP